MFQYFKDLTPVESGYFYIALVCSVLFVVQSMFTFLDVGDNFEVDNSDFDFSEGFGLAIHLFSIRGIIGFFMLFGWSGLVFSKEGMAPIVVFLIAFLCGFAMMVIISLIYYFANKLGESGNVDIKNSIGKECEVYIPIPGNNNGTGKVSIILNNSLKELEAISLHGEIKSGEIVQVVNVLNDKLVVKKIKK